MADLNEYLLKMAKRIADLEVQAEQLNSRLADNNDEIGEQRRNFQERLHDLRSDVNEAGEHLDEIEKTVDNIINGFKTVARTNQRERLENRIDDWQPEERVTYEQAKRRIDERS